uniref:Uncharacterized protein n=1 Tax=Anguilla anguilla TaxID=7936 RepID=A0A0E9Q8T5_ANGAN
MKHLIGPKLTRHHNPI